MLKKPPQIANNTFKSAKWDEITKGRNFNTADIPVISLLCQWYAVIETCIDDITVDDEVRVAYANDIGDIKAMPQMSIMKQASAEIRALNKQLGINDEVAPEKQASKPEEEWFKIIYGNRAKRQAKATRQTRATA